MTRISSIPVPVPIPRCADIRHDFVKPDRPHKHPYINIGRPSPDTQYRPWTAPSTGVSGIPANVVDRVREALQNTSW